MMRKHSKPLVWLLAAWAVVSIIQAAAFALAGAYGNTLTSHTIYQGTIHPARTEIVEPARSGEADFTRGTRIRRFRTINRKEQLNER